ILRIALRAASDVPRRTGKSRRVAEIHCLRLETPLPFGRMPRAALPRGRPPRRTVARIGAMSDSANRRLETLGDWLATPLKRRCLANEQRLARRVLERVFGELLLQVGCWGGRHAFLRYARTQRKALVDWRMDSGADVVCDTAALAIPSDSVDAVILPHTLERIPSPHALLREVDRVLRADGQIIVL